MGGEGPLHEEASARGPLEGRRRGEGARCPRSPLAGGLAWEGPAIGLLDLDAFFASVERLDHPELAGRPLIVGGSTEHRGVVSCASYEARAFGVHSAMPSAQALRLCPDAVWTTGHFDRYRQVSNEVMGLIRDRTPRVEQVSIDEAFFDITPGRAGRDPILVCRELQEEVSALGVTCSIGLGTSKTIAKVASERDKPRGLTVVMPGMEASFLAPLPVRAMSGIGAATQAKLAGAGIRTLGELGRADPAELEALLGVYGPRLRERALGRERSVVRLSSEREAPKSVSNERTFSHDLTEEADVLAAIAHVSSLVGARLRRKGLSGRRVTLKLKFDATTTHTVQCQLEDATDNEAVFGRAARGLLRVAWSPGTPVRLVGVAVSDFSARPTQLRLFDDAPSDEPASAPDPHETRTERGTSPRTRAARSLERADRDERMRELSVTADRLRERFGKNAVSFGRDLRMRDASSDTAPMDKDDD